MGYKKVILKSDQEPATIALLEECSRTTSVNIVREEGKAYDSASNGKIESMVQVIEKQFRAMRDALETKAREKTAP